MLVFETAAIVTNVPVTRCVLLDPYVLPTGKCLLVQRICDDFPDGMANFPSFENFFDVQIELPDAGFRHKVSQSKALLAATALAL